MYSKNYICIQNLQTTLSFWILFIHDSLLLGSLFLLAAGLGCLLALSVSLFQEVFFHPSPIPVSFLFSLNMQIVDKKRAICKCDLQSPEQKRFTS